MIRSGRQKNPPDSNEEIGYRLALRRLANSNLSLIAEILSEIVADVSRAPDFSVPERREVLFRLFAQTLKCLSDLNKDASVAPKELWKNRDRSRSISPLAFLKQHYSEEIAAGLLTKSAVRRSDFSLYRALLNPSWAKDRPKDNIFSKLPSKKTTDDKALNSLPEGITRAAIIRTLPPEIREMFRILHVAEMRRHRSKKA
jgi:hypothetical protein